MGLKWAIAMAEGCGFEGEWELGCEGLGVGVKGWIFSPAEALWQFTTAIERPEERCVAIATQ